MQGVEPAHRRREAAHPPDRDWVFKSLERMRAAILKIESSADQASRSTMNDNLAGLRQSLKTGREIGRRSYDGPPLLHRFPNHIADHHRASCDPDARSNRFSRDLVFAYCRDRGQGRVHRAFGGGLMCLRPAELGEDPVSEQFGHITFVLGDGFRHGIMIPAENTAHLFGIEPLGQFGRSDQIAEHNRQLATLGFGVCRWRGCGGLGH